MATRGTPASISSIQMNMNLKSIFIMPKNMFVSPKRKQKTNSALLKSTKKSFVPTKIHGAILAYVLMKIIDHDLNNLPITMN